ncbi:hypothetical protein HK096_011148, partial [Nowakowskiella sp. JEL0078]
VLDEIDVSYIAQENDDGANENENQIEEFIQIYNSKDLSDTSLEDRIDSLKNARIAAQESRKQT